MWRKCPDYPEGKVLSGKEKWRLASAPTSIIPRLIGEHDLNKSDKMPQID